MRLGPTLDGGNSSGRAPRVGIAVAHDGWRRDLSRALVSAGCRVVEVDAVEAARPRMGIDAFVGDVDAAPEALALDAAMQDRIVVWSADAAKASNGLPGVGWDLLAKPFSVADLERSLERILLPSHSTLGQLDPVLASREPGMTHVVARARRLAERDLDLVIEGELGVGRMALARASHDWSPRAEAPFVVLDRVELAAAGAAEGVDAIHRSGAEVGGGTLVAVEPAEWTPSAQRALASTLRDDEGTRVVTVVSETLEASVEGGRLRRELADRLDVSRIRVPALRARPADHRALCEAVARRVARRLGRETPLVDEATVDAWAEEGFPGNLLGIESRLRAAMLRDDDGRPATGALEIRRHEDERDSLDLKRLERDTIVRALAHWQGNRTRASESLGISVRTLRNKIREYGLR